MFDDINSSTLSVSACDALFMIDQFLVNKENSWKHTENSESFSCISRALYACLGESSPRRMYLGPSRPFA